jgi:hypothetical protein
MLCSFAMRVALRLAAGTQSDPIHRATHRSPEKIFEQGVVSDEFLEQRGTR